MKNDQVIVKSPVKKRENKPLPIMAEEPMLEIIVDAIQEKKGRKIAIIDMRPVSGAIAKYYVVSEGEVPTQVEAIAMNVVRRLKEELQERPIAQDGYTNSLWVASDYGNLMVHTFLPETREFYNIEQLWSDVPVLHIEDEE